MSNDEIRHFLVVYDVPTLKAEVTQFEDDYEAAVAAYRELEKRYLDDDSHDVVLLGADSIETIKRTHSSYFETTEHGFERYVRGLLAAK